jgi:hypothetical protein
VAMLCGKNGENRLEHGQEAALAKAITLRPRGCHP